MKSRAILQMGCTCVMFLLIGYVSSQEAIGGWKPIVRIDVCTQTPANEYANLDRGGRYITTSNGVIDIHTGAHFGYALAPGMWVEGIRLKMRARPNPEGPGSGTMVVTAHYNDTWAVRAPIGSFTMPYDISDPDPAYVDPPIEIKFTPFVTGPTDSIHLRFTTNPPVYSGVADVEWIEVIGAGCRDSKLLKVNQSFEAENYDNPGEQAGIADMGGYVSVTANNATIPFRLYHEISGDQIGSLTLKLGNVVENTTIRGYIDSAGETDYPYFVFDNLQPNSVVCQHSFNIPPFPPQASGNGHKLILKVTNPGFTGGELAQIDWIRVGNGIPGSEKLIQNHASRQFVELRGYRYEDNAIVQQSVDFEMHPNQIWKFTPVTTYVATDEDLYVIQVTGTGTSLYLTTRNDDLSDHTPVVIDSTGDPTVWAVDSDNGALGSGARIRIAGTNKALQVPAQIANLDEIPLEIDEYVGAPTQIWEISDIDPDEPEVFNKPQNFMLRYNLSSKAIGCVSDTPAEGANIVVAVADGSPRQAWNPIYLGAGYYELHSELGNAFLLEADSSQQVQLYSDMGDFLNQRWKMVPLGAGFVKFVPGHGDIPENEHSLAAQIVGGFPQDWEMVIEPTRYDDPFHQHFYLQERRYSGYYHIENLETGEILSIDSNSGNVIELSHVGDSAVSAANAWNIVSAGSGYHRIVGIVDGNPLSLHRSNDGTEDGNPVDLTTADNQFGFHWDILPVVTNGVDTHMKIVARIPGYTGEKVLSIATDLCTEEYQQSNRNQLWVLREVVLPSPEL